jgi:GT2 family glycosyltransferase
MSGRPAEHRVVWAADTYQPQRDRSVTLGPLGLGPGWYRLAASVAGGPAIVSVDIRLVSGGPGLRVRLEAAEQHGFAKIVRVSEAIESLTAAAEGAYVKAITAIRVTRMGKAAISIFLAKKAWRYAWARRAGFELRPALARLRAAIGLPANFVFRSSYAAQDEAAAYPIWRAIHESPAEAAEAANRLGGIAKGRILRIGALFGGAPNQADVDFHTSDGVAIETVSIADIGREPGTWDFILPLDRSGRFAPGGIERLALALLADPGLAAVFADSDLLLPDGTRAAPRLKPPWDRELLWCRDYIGAPLLIRWQPDLLPALGSPEAAGRPAYALALALLDQRPRAALGRVHAILFHETGQPPAPEDDGRVVRSHLSRTGLPATLAETCGSVVRVNWPIPATPPRVSVIIPTRDHPELLRSCVESILATTATLPQEIIVADNGSVLPETAACLAEIASRGIARIVPCPGPFNFSRINNEARREATGDVLVLLNDDARALSPGWLGELVSLAIRPEIGAVGAMLLYPDGSIQHAGALLGIGGTIVEHAFRHWPGDSGGYLDLLRCRREVGAVTAACLAVAAAHYDRVGGLDENLQVTLNDIDFCLRLRDKGLINVWTPWARLEHLESKSRGLALSADQLATQRAEVKLFSERWQHLPPRDITYHPGLSDLTPDYQLAI